MTANIQTLIFAPSAKKVTNGKSVSVQFDLTNMEINGTRVTQASVDYLLTYGLKQSLSDSYASAKDQAEFDAMLSKRLKKIIEGTMSIREAGSPTDPFESTVIRFAKARLSAIAKKQGKKLPKVDSDEYRNLLDKVRNGKAKDELELKARKHLAELAEVAELDDDELDLDGVSESEEETPAE